MNRSKVLTNDNINVLLEQIDNSNISEFEGSEEEDFDMVNNIKDNEDIDQLLLENDEYFEQLENSNLNFSYANISVDASQIDSNIRLIVINSNNNLTTNIEQIKYINTMK